MIYKILFIFLSVFISYSLHFKIGLQKGLDDLRSILDEQKREQKILDIVHKEIEKGSSKKEIKEVTLQMLLDEKFLQIKNYFNIKDILGKKKDDQIINMDTLNNELRKLVKNFEQFKEIGDLNTMNDRLASFSNNVIGAGELGFIKFMFEMHKQKKLAAIVNKLNELKIYLYFFLSFPATKEIET